MLSKGVQQDAAPTPDNEVRQVRGEGAVVLNQADLPIVLERDREIEEHDEIMGSPDRGTGATFNQQQSRGNEETSRMVLLLIFVIIIGAVRVYAGRQGADSSNATFSAVSLEDNFGEGESDRFARGSGQVLPGSSSRWAARNVIFGQATQLVEVAEQDDEPETWMERAEEHQLSTQIDVLSSNALHVDTHSESSLAIHQSEPGRTRQEALPRARGSLDSAQPMTEKAVVFGNHRVSSLPEEDDGLGRSKPVLHIAAGGFD